jgi:neurexin
MICVSANVQGDSHVLDYDQLRVAKRPKRHGSDTMLKARENFVGRMQQFVFNGEPLFDLARTARDSSPGRGSMGFNTNAKFNRQDKLVNFPITFRTREAYFLTKMNIYGTFTLYFEIKTIQDSGIILFSGQGKGNDFMALEVFDGYVRYVYNAGGGTRLIEPHPNRRVNDNKWHTIALLRPTLTQHVLRVDGSASKDELPDDRNVHFDTDDTLYIGGIRRQMYSTIDPLILSKSGLQGCLASFDLDGDTRNILEHRADIPLKYQDDVQEGCQGRPLN